MSTETALKQSLDNLSLSSKSKILQKNYVPSTGSEESTPCKSARSSKSVDENSPMSPLSASKNRLRTNLNTLKNLPPIRSSPLQEVSPNVAKNALLPGKAPSGPQMMDMTPQKKTWDPSFASHEKTAVELNDRHLPWTSDIRQRKAPVAQVVARESSIVASPRTPHISQINVKRQKQKSQLSRSVCLNGAVVGSDGDIGHKAALKANQGFAIPALPVKKTTVSTHALPSESLKLEVESWKQKYQEELKAREMLEAKYHHEQKIRIRLEMDYKLLQRKCQDLERKLQQADQDPNISFQTAASDYEDNFEN